MIGLGSVLSDSHNDCEFFQQGSMYFDGSDQDVNIDNLCDGILDEAVKTDATSFSVSAWVRVGETLSSAAIFKCIAGTDANNQINLFYHHGGSELRFTTKFGGSADVCNQGSNSIRNDGLWHHVVGTVDVTDNTTELWVDGSKKESVSGVGTLNATITKASIGSSTAASNYWIGDIDEVAMWSRQLTDAEVAILYAGRDTGIVKAIELQNHGTLAEGLIGFYRFEEKGGSSAINQAQIATSLHGTINNGDTNTHNTITP